MQLLAVLRCIRCGKVITEGFTKHPAPRSTLHTSWCFGEHQLNRTVHAVKVLEANSSLWNPLMKAAAAGLDLGHAHEPQGDPAPPPCGTSALASEASTANHETLWSSQRVALCSEEKLTSLIQTEKS